MFTRFGEEEDTVLPDLEYTPTGLNQFWLRKPLFFNEFCQTDSFGLIVSNDAVFDTPMHTLLLLNGYLFCTRVGITDYMSRQLRLNNL